MGGGRFWQTEAAPVYASEFIGTFFLTFILGSNVLESNDFGPLASGLTLMMGVYALGSVSGGHFNPAVSVAVALTGRIDVTLASKYIATQMLGGIFGALAYLALFGQNFNVKPNIPQFDVWSCFVVEAIYTFGVSFAVLNVAVARNSQGNQYYGLAIGSILVAGGFAGGRLSSIYFNPAIVFGADVVSINKGFGWSFAYMGAELLGGGGAALLFRLAHPEDFRGFEGTMAPKLVCEFLGTFLLVFTSALCKLAQLSNVHTAFAVTFCALSLAYSIGVVSGGHFNPAISACIAATRRSTFGVVDTLIYSITQILGAIAASILARHIFDAGVPVGPAPGKSWVQAGAAEAVGTFLLSYAFLAIATSMVNRRNLSHFWGLPICLTWLLVMLTFGHISGALINPAFSVGFDVSQYNMQNCLVYLSTQFVGAFLAAAVFYITHVEEFVVINE